MRGAFEQWIGKRIVVQLDLGEMKVGLHGTLLKEKHETLVMKTQENCEFEIYKTMVLAVEEARAVTVLPFY
jgi:RNase P/RNase MRP subunit p29